MGGEGKTVVRCGGKLRGIRSEEKKRAVRVGEWCARELRERRVKGCGTESVGGEKASPGERVLREAGK